MIFDNKPNAGKGNASMFKKYRNKSIRYKRFK